MNRAALAHRLLIEIEERIRTRARERRRFYRDGHGKHWPDWRSENDMLLRELLAVRRAAKSAMRSESRSLALGDHFARAPLGVLPVEPESADPITAAKWERERWLGMGGSL